MTNGFTQTRKFDGKIYKFYKQVHQVPTIPGKVPKGTLIGNKPSAWDEAQKLAKKLRKINGWKIRVIDLGGTVGLYVRKTS